MQFADLSQLPPIDEQSNLLKLNALLAQAPLLREKLIAPASTAINFEHAGRNFNLRSSRTPEMRPPPATAQTHNPCCAVCWVKLKTNGTLSGNSPIHHRKGIKVRPSVSKRDWLHNGWLHRSYPPYKIDIAPSALMASYFNSGVVVGINDDIV